MDESQLRAVIRGERSADGPRQVYADWLESSGRSAEAEVVRAEIETHRGGEGPAWERLHRARGAADRRWLFGWEQPSLMRSLPLPLPAEPSRLPISLRPPGDRKGSCPLRSRPDLGEEALSFDWIDALPERAARTRVALPDYWPFARFVAAQGFSLPDEMGELIRSHSASLARLSSETGEFVIGRYEPSPHLGSAIVPFYQDYGEPRFWGLWLHPSGAHAVVSFSIVYAERYVSEPSTEQDNLDFGEWQIEAVRFAGPSLAAFLYRRALEEQIRRAFRGEGRPRRVYTPEERRYLDAYRS